MSARTNTETPDAEAIFEGAGTMTEHYRSVDWTRTPLGPVRTWPKSLKTALRIVLCSRHPMFVWWGRDLINLYNETYAPMLGKRHPWALGKPAKEVWHEIWDIIGPQTEAVLTRGQANWAEHVLLIMQRNDFTEEAYFTYAYTPVPDDEGGVGGVFNACSEDTGRILGERRLRTLREVAAAAHHGQTVDATSRLLTKALATNPHDIPFAVLYELDAQPNRARRAAVTGIDPSSSACPAVIDLDAGATAWPFCEVLGEKKLHVVDDLSRFGALPGGPWPESPRQAVLLAIAKPTNGRPAGFLVAGVSPRRPLDPEYLGFLGLLADCIANAWANARSHEAERQRADALAALDQAKTAFFSNVSHEFRTPLTLILGPVEESLAAKKPLEVEQTALVHRNGLRLLRLVNSLLDFARIEAGRAQASYEPVDLATLTADLASAYRSVIEKAGMRLVVATPSISGRVYADRDMWEKIVLNLLSNAFKYTIEGEISVSLRENEGAVELAVRDTGIGIPESELPRLFERFHRVEGAKGRTHEGTGIGLALVRELAKLHGGTVAVESVHGKGTTFTVTIKKGRDHLPRDRVRDERTSPSAPLRAEAHVEEALRWLPASEREDRKPTTVAVSTDVLAPDESRTARILLADDSADMRDYVRRLLADRYDVTTVADGQAALEAARREPPDLVLSDVMMPRLDGFGLLHALRADPRLRTVPVILLSARAGEEAAVEGLGTGADDYLVKPFAARELLARVHTHLKMSQLRRNAEETLRRSHSELERRVAERTNELATINVELRGEVAERRRAEEALRRQVSRTTLLNQVARSIMGRHDIYSIFHVVLRQLENDFRIDLGAVYLCDLRARTISVAARGTKTPPGSDVGLPEGSVVSVDELGLGPCLTGEQVYVPDTVRASAALLRSLSEKGMRSGAATPIVIDSKATGILVVGRSEVDAFGSDEREFLKALSEHVALAVEQTRLHSDLEGAYESLQKAQDQVVQQERLRALGEMASGIAHDFNNALGPILGFSELLLERPQDLENRDITATYLRYMNTSAKDGARIVSRLKEFFRQRGENEVFKPVQINDVVEQTVALTEPKWKGQAEASGRAIRAETVLAKTHAFPGNESELRELLTNLIFNAVDAMPQGGSITIRTEQEAKDVVLKVTDTGTGMTEDVQRRCLEPFFTTKGEHGTGLGLAMVHGIVRRHDGTLEIQSAVGKGTTFILRFPMQSSADLESGSHAIGAKGHRLRVLVVEDQPQMRELVTALLTRDGHSVEGAPDGHVALGKFAAGKFDLVITDRAMPGMSGDQLARAVKAVAPETPVFLLSGFGELMTAAGEKPEGVDHIMGKPVTLKALRDAIARIGPPA